MRPTADLRSVQHADHAGRDSYEMSDEIDLATSTMLSSHGHSVTGSHLSNDNDDDSTNGLEGPAHGTDSTEKTTAWKIHWLTPSLMLGHLLLGIGFALGHHFYWQSLDGTLVPSRTKQEWFQRYGLASAFLVQSTLRLAVGTAFVQRIWLTIRQKPMQLENLDRAFSLRSDIFAFFSREVLKKAKLLCLLGICTWCFPIASTITSSTLSVRSTSLSNATRVNVPIHDFSNTSLSSDNWAYWEGGPGAGMLAGPSPAISRMASATSTSMYIIPFDAPFPNSSYSLLFNAPAFRCDNLSTAISDDSLDTGDFATLQDAWDETMAGTSGNIYAAAAPEYVNGSSMSSHLFLSTSRISGFGNNYSCHLWNSSYLVDFVFENGIESASLRQLTHIAPLNIVAGNMGFSYAEGEVQFWTIGKVLTNILATGVGLSASLELTDGDTLLMQTGIAACPEFELAYAQSGAIDYRSGSFDWMCRAGSVPGAIEDLSHNLTLSILSSALLSNVTTAEIFVRSAVNVYSYNWQDLCLAYAVAITAAAACVAVGLHALLKNGYSAGANFSSIMMTTRNADLDELARGHCLGESPLADDVKKTVLRYGILKLHPWDDSTMPHAAFGLRDDTVTMKKGQACW